MKHIPSSPFRSCLVRNTQGAVDTPDGCARIQRDHKRLKWAVTNLMKFNKENYKVPQPQPGRNKPTHQCMLGADWLESSLAETALGVLVDRVDGSRQYALVAKANSSTLGSSTGSSIASGMREIFRFRDQAHWKKIALAIVCIFYIPLASCWLQRWQWGTSSVL